MKLILLVFATILLCCKLSHAQTIKYVSSFEKAKELAKQENKPIAVVITIQPPVPSPNFMKGLKDATVAMKFNENFINYKVAREDVSMSQNIIREYNVTTFPSLIFLDAKGGLLFKEVASASTAKPLLVMTDKAIAAMKEMSLVDYDSSYNTGNKDKTFLKNYIAQRQRAGITDNADLIETYVNALSVSDLNNYQEVLFILKAGPIVDSNAFKLARTNKLLVDNIYKKEPLADRQAINRATIQNTLSRAIATRNMNRALSAATFSRGTFVNNYEEGNKNMQAVMLQYYLGAKDIAQYLRNAINYYDNYYMKMSLDSVRKKDSVNFEAAKRNAKVIDSVKIDDRIMRRTTSFSYAKDAYAIGLNNAAWNVFQLGKDNNEYLVKAMLWSKRSIEHSPKAAFYDTYAHILYKLKLYTEAEVMQKKAFESAKEEKIESSSYLKEYEKIKRKTL